MKSQNRSAVIKVFILMNSSSRTFCDFLAGNMIIELNRFEMVFGL